MIQMNILNACKVCIIFLFVFLALCTPAITHANAVPNIKDEQPISKSEQDFGSDLARRHQENINKAKNNLPNQAKVDRMDGTTAQVKAKSTVTTQVVLPDNTTQTKKDSLVSKIKIPASLPQTAKALGRGLGVNLLASALYEMLGKAVDYVLDPANNQVIIPPQGGLYRGYGKEFFATLEEAANHNCKKSYEFNPNTGCFVVTELPYEPKYKWWRVRGLTQKGEPALAWSVTMKEGQMTVDLDKIAEYVHKQAEQGDTQAQGLLQQIAEERLQAGEFDQAIKGSAQTQDSALPDNDPLPNPKPNTSPNPNPIPSKPSTGR